MFGFIQMHIIAFEMRIKRHRHAEQFNFGYIGDLIHCQPSAKVVKPLIVKMQTPVPLRHFHTGPFTILIFCLVTVCK